MSEPVVDLSNLRELTDGDTELERELFAEFIASSAEMLKNMQSLCVDGYNEDWYQNAHALKGLAANLGANKMMEAGKLAQDSSESPAAEKQSILTTLEADFSAAKMFLENEMNS